MAQSEQKVPTKTDLPKGFHRGKGYVNDHGILFPIGYKFLPFELRVNSKKEGERKVKDFAAIIGWGAEMMVHLNHCVKCGANQLATEAAHGECQQCHYSAFDYLDEIKEA